MRLKLPIPLCALLFLTSCYDRFYFADSANVPSFTQAGQAKAALTMKPELQGVSMSSKGDVCPTGDIAYAVAPHFAVIASYRSIVNKSGYLYPVVQPYDFSGNMAMNMNGHRFEAGAGYFTGFGRHGVFELYGGYGNGITRGDNYGGGISFSSRYNRFFLQAQAGTTKKYCTIMYGVRVATQKYYTFSSSDSGLRNTINVLQNDQPADFTNMRFFFVEPFMDMEFGARWAFFNVQLGFSKETSNFELIEGNQPLYLSFGLSLRHRISRPRPIQDKPGN